MIRRKILTPNDAVDLDDIAARLTPSERRYEQTPNRSEWKFTGHDLDLLLKRLADKPDLANVA